MLIKPEAVKNHHVGDILSRVEKSGFSLAALKMVQLTPEQAKQFYKVHADKPFYNELTDYIASGPIVAVVLSGPQAIHRYRDLMGATNPEKALPGTLRKDFGESVQQNAVHGSDSLESAQQEIPFFFPEGLKGF